jgi:Phosphoesterase family
VVASAALTGCGIPVAGATRPVAGLPRLPVSHPSHLIVVIEENHSFEQVIGSPTAPFINRLAAAGTLLTNYHAITHPRCDLVLPFGSLGADLAAGRLPTVAFIASNLDDDMHSGPVRVADAWLQRLFDQLEANRVWRTDTRVVVTFDEGVRDDTRSCCDGLGRGGLIPTIVAGPRVRRGRDATPYTHYSLLRSIEAAFGLPFLGHAADGSTTTIPAVARRA